jgi:hypothetical protein
LQREGRSYSALQDVMSFLLRAAMTLRTDAERGAGFRTPWALGPRDHTRTWECSDKNVIVPCSERVGFDQNASQRHPGKSLKNRVESRIFTTGQKTLCDLQNRRAASPMLPMCSTEASLIPTRASLRFEKAVQLAFGARHPAVCLFHRHVFVSIRKKSIP